MGTNWGRMVDSLRSDTTVLGSGDCPKWLYTCLIVHCRRRRSAFRRLGRQIKGWWRLNFVLTLPRGHWRSVCQRWTVTVLVAAKIAVRRRRPLIWITLFLWISPPASLAPLPRSYETSTRRSLIILSRLRMIIPPLSPGKYEWNFTSYFYIFIL